MIKNFELWDSWLPGYLDFAERQAEKEQPMTMDDWANYLNRILTSTGEQLLLDGGRVSHQEAMDHATTEYRKYKQRNSAMWSKII